MQKSIINIKILNEGKKKRISNNAMLSQKQARKKSDTEARGKKKISNFEPIFI